VLSVVLERKNSEIAGFLVLAWKLLIGMALTNGFSLSAKILK
jgi:hypothetical protein